MTYKVRNGIFVFFYDISRYKSHDNFFSITCLYFLDVEFWASSYHQLRKYGPTTCRELRGLTDKIVA